jgi:hypothetical protein
MGRAIDVMNGMSRSGPPNEMLVVEATGRPTIRSTDPSGAKRMSRPE